MFSRFGLFFIHLQNDFSKICHSFELIWKGDVSLYNVGMNQEKLLKWYRAQKRELPFRKDRNPYRIWVSEIMAQQTRIEAMLVYFERFIERYPTIEALAKASEDELLKSWQGLGYYSRAKNLQKAAKVCLEKYDGNLPSTKAELCKLPGIGEYTAGAIASIAFKERVCAIDGNVVRVLARYLWLERFFETKKERQVLEDYLLSHLPAKDDMPDFTQALMELGATICQPKKVQCDLCPLHSTCLGANQDNPLRLPLKKPKTKRKVEEKSVIIQIAFHENTWWMHVRKRPKKGLLAGLYEFDEQFPEVIEAIYPLKPYTHIFSHKEWAMQGSIVVTQWQPDFLPFQGVCDDIAIPSAFQPFFQQTLEWFQTTFASSHSKA